VGIVRLAENLGINCDKVLESMAYAFYFQAGDENGEKSAPDMLFDKYLSQGIEFTFREVCGFDPVKDKKLVSEMIQKLQKIR
jgi:mannitol-1-phosphate 5-dehydrogenase